MKVCSSYLFCFFLISLLYSCKKPGCFESAGPIVTVERSTASFYQIDLFDNINLVLTQDSVERIRVEAGQQLQANISTTINNGILTIKNNTTCQWLRNPAEQINVYVSVKNLIIVNYNGSGNITSTNTLVADNITFNSKEGAGTINVTLKAQHTFAYLLDEDADFIFHGETETFNTYTNARGSVDFTGFKVKKLIIEYGGLKDAYVNADSEVHAILYFKGNVYYKGNPTIIDTQYYSSGRLIRLP